MALPQITIGGETIWLLKGESLARGAVLTLEHEFRTEIEESLTLRESRRKGQLSMRSKAVVEMVLESLEAAALRTTLSQLGSSKVALALQMDRVATTGRTASFYAPQVWLRTDTDAAVLESALGGSPPVFEVMPLLIGRIKRPKIKAISETQCSLRIELNEQSPYEWRLEVRDLGGSTSAFPSIDANWTAEIEDSSEDNIEEDEIGRGRLPLISGDEAPSKWGQRATFTLEKDQGAEILSFWQAQFGRWGSFDAPVWFRPHAAPSTDTPDGIKARFASDIIRVQWADTDICSMQTVMWQLPWELNLPSGEIPKQPSEAYLYTFESKVPRYFGGPIVRYLTEWESDLSVGGINYISGLVEHTKLEDDDSPVGGMEAKVRAAIEAQTGLLDILNGDMDAPIDLTISVCDPEDLAAGADILFKGRCEEVELEDREIEAEAMEEKLPRLPSFTVSKEATRLPDELWLVYTATVETGSSVTTLYLNFEDGEHLRLPDTGRLDGWRVRLSSDLEEWRTIASHADGGANGDIDLSVASWGALSTGDQVIIHSPYIAFGTLKSLSADGLTLVAELPVSETAAVVMPGGAVEVMGASSFRTREIVSGSLSGRDMTLGLQRALPDATVGDKVSLFSGWDGTLQGIRDNFPLAEPHTFIYPSMPFLNPATSRTSPFLKSSTESKK